MQLSTFAGKNSQEVVDAFFERVIRSDGIELTVELTSFCWLKGRPLSITVTSRLGENRFDSPRLFKDATLADLERLIRRIGRTDRCHAGRCAGKYLVDDRVRTSNPKRFCERHRVLELGKARAVKFKAREAAFKLLDPGMHKAILEKCELQDDEAVQDAIYVYARRIAGAIEGNENARKLLADIDRDMGHEADARAMLGVAEYLVRSGAQLGQAARSYALKRLKVELRPGVLEDWKNPNRRKRELTSFRKSLGV